MPKLKGIDQKYLFDKQVDKENDTVAYNDEKHLYFSKDDGAPYISVTTLIGKYKQPFNAEFWASYKALESLLDISDFQSVKSTLLSTKQWDDKYLEAFEIDHTTFDAKKAEILQSYEDKKNIACERGTKIHAELEQRFYDLDPTAVAKYAGGGKFSCKKGYYHLDLPKAIYPEFLISHKFDDFLKIAGQIDLLVIDGKDVYIKDGKSNAKIDKDSFYDRNTKKKQTMKYPLTNIPDCNFYHYALQLSIYAYLLQTIRPSFRIRQLAIVHFDHDGNEVEYECPYLKDEVAKLLLHHRRQMKIQYQLDKDKPIIF